MTHKQTHNIYKHIIININRMFPGDLTGSPDEMKLIINHALSPRYDSSEECRVSYSLILGGYYG